MGGARDDGKSIGKSTFIDDVRLLSWPWQDFKLFQLVEPIHHFYKPVTVEDKQKVVVT